MYTAKSMGQLVQVEGQGVECVDLLNNQPPYIQWYHAKVVFMLFEIIEW
jgi:hypothetical protein